MSGAIKHVLAEFRVFDLTMFAECGGHQAEKELQGMMDALRVARDAIVGRERGSTHWEGCESVHLSCRALRLIEPVLYGEDSRNDKEGG